MPAVYATPKIEIELVSSDGWTDVTADVLQDPPLAVRYGIQDTDPMALVADTGSASFALDNSRRNSGGKQGYYSPGHANVRSGFDEGKPVRVSFAYSGTTYYKFVGRIQSIEMMPDEFGDAYSLVTATDWMDYAAGQKIGDLAIQSSKRVDQVLPTILAKVPIQPRATSYGTGQETFDSVFNTDQGDKMSVRSLLEKLALNEYGQMYVEGDTVGGETFRFDNRHVRMASVPSDSIITLSSDMGELEIEYTRERVKNIVKARVYPLDVDSDASTVIWYNQIPFSIDAGATVTMQVAYRDPGTGQRISAADVVDPLVAGTDYDFGSASGTPASDMTSSLSIAATIGGNTATLALTNNAATPGYVNLLQLRGKGIYAYDPLTSESRDSDSVAQRGELELAIDLKQHSSPNTGQAFAHYLRGRMDVPTKYPRTVRFVANISDARMIAALSGEPSSRFILAHGLTGLNDGFFINGIELELTYGRILTCNWICVPAGALMNYLIYDVTFPGWDNAYWAF
jgi:hypothetical protein